MVGVEVISNGGADCVHEESKTAPDRSKVSEINLIFRMPALYQ